MKSAHCWITWLDNRTSIRSLPFWQWPLIVLFRWTMWLASGAYFLATSIRNYSFDRGWVTVKRATIPVISIGNVTAGGTGKTPVVAYLAHLLRRKDIRVSLVSRGYGATAGAVNDEALELERQLPDVPHIQNPDRFAAVQLASEELAAQIVLLDDGMQHRRLHRDHEIVLIDATNPFGFNYLLPRGLLRESLSGLRRATIIMLSRADLVSAEERSRIWSVVQRYAPRAIALECNHQPSCLQRWPQRAESLELLRGKKILAFCGIGNPKAFRRTLENLNYHVAELLEFSDHCPYDRADVERLQHWVREHAARVDAVVCTAKDIVKLQVASLGSLPLFSLQVELQLTSGRDRFDAWFEQLLTQLPQDELWEE